MRMLEKLRGAHKNPFTWAGLTALFVGGAVPLLLGGSPPGDNHEVLIEVYKGLAHGGPTAILFGIMLLFVVPRTIGLFREQIAAFRDEMQAERAAHREEVLMVGNGFAEVKTELAKQTMILDEIRRNGSSDLPPPPRPSSRPR
jgi:hypothetical protein